MNNQGLTVARPQPGISPSDTTLLAHLPNIVSAHNDEHQTWLQAFYGSLGTNALLFITAF